MSRNPSELTHTISSEGNGIEWNGGIYPFIGLSYTFRLSSNFTDLVHLTTMSNVSHPPNLIICSTSTPFLCRFDANVLLNVGAYNLIGFVLVL